jgi:hypothetical protein
MKHLLREVRRVRPDGPHSVKSYTIYKCENCGVEKSARFEFQEVDCVAEKNWRMIGE